MPGWCQESCVKFMRVLFSSLRMAYGFHLQSQTADFGFSQRENWIQIWSHMSSVGPGQVLCVYIRISMYKTLVIYLPSTGSEYL